MCETRAWRSLSQGLGGCLDMTPPLLRSCPEAHLWPLGSIKDIPKDMLTEIQLFTWPAQGQPNSGLGLTSVLGMVSAPTSCAISGWPKNSSGMDYPSNALSALTCIDSPSQSGLRISEHHVHLPRRDPASQASMYTHLVSTFFKGLSQLRP